MGVYVNGVWHEELAAPPGYEGGGDLANAPAPSSSNQPSAPAPSGGGDNYGSGAASDPQIPTFQTPNGPKTAVQMYSELKAAGWQGGEDLATAYARTANGAVTQSSITSSAGSSPIANPRTIYPNGSVSGDSNNGGGSGSTSGLAPYNYAAPEPGRRPPPFNGSPTPLDMAPQPGARFGPNPAATGKFQDVNTTAGGGYGPYATAQPPELSVLGMYQDNGRMIRKSSDQFGNSYFEDAGPASTGAPIPQASVPTTPAATTPAQGTQQTQAAPATTATSPQPGQPQTATPANANTAQIVTPQGVFQVTPEAKQAWESWQTQVAKDAQSALQFTQGLERDKFDLDKLIATSNSAYQQSLLQFNDRQLAQQAAQAAMEQEYKRQVLELQRQQAAQTVSIERERLNLQRRSLRGNRAAPVRIR